MAQQRPRCGRAGLVPFLLLSMVSRLAAAGFFTILAPQCAQGGCSRIFVEHLPAQPGTLEFLEGMETSRLSTISHRKAHRRSSRQFSVRRVELTGETIFLGARNAQTGRGGFGGEESLSHESRISAPNERIALRISWRIRWDFSEVVRRRTPFSVIPLGARESCRVGRRECKNGSFVV